MMTLFKLGMTLLSTKNKSFSEIISGKLLMITDLMELLGINLTIHCLILELLLASKILIASSEVSETSPRTLNFSKIVILWMVIIAS